MMGPAEVGHPENNDSNEAQPPDHDDVRPEGKTIKDEVTGGLIRPIITRNL